MSATSGRILPCLDFSIRLDSKFFFFLSFHSTECKKFEYYYWHCNAFFQKLSTKVTMWGFFNNLFGGSENGIEQPSGQQHQNGGNGWPQGQ
jgi:hypothetical protein